MIWVGLLESSESLGMCHMFLSDLEKEFFMNRNVICQSAPLVNGFGLGIVGGSKGSYQPLPLFRDPQGNVWVGAQFAGQEYGVEFIVPSSSELFKAVCAVDGLNILGKTSLTSNTLRSSGASREGGWVMTPPSGVGENVIPGWFRDNSEVARFFFADDENAYSTQMNEGTELGVIGVRYFFERQSRPSYRTLETLGGGEASLESFGGATRGGGAKGVGTGYGRKEEFQSDTTTFAVDGSRQPVDVVLYVGFASQLQAAGYTPIAASSLPSAFPGKRSEPACPEPEGYTG